MSGALVLQRGPLTQQPQYPAPIDWSNPLSRGLQFAYIPGGGPLDATGKRRQLSDLTPQFGSFGKITPQLNGSTFPTFGYCDSPSTGGFTVVVLGAFDPAPGTGASDQREPLLSLGNWKISNRQGNAGYTAYGVADYDVTCPLPASGIMCASVSFGNSARFFVGGAFKASTAVTSPNAATNAQFAIGTRSGGTDITGKSQVALALYWDRALSDAEIAQISANPWQLFQAPRRRLWLAVNNSGTNVSATPGASNAAGLAASVSLPTTIAASLGTVADTGLSASIAASTVVSASAGATSATGRSATVIAATTINAAGGSASATGLTASVTNGTIVTGALGAASATGLSATIQTATTIACGVGAASAAGLSGSVSNGLAVNAATGAASASGLAAQIILPTTIVASVGVASSTGFGASVSSGNAIGTAVGTASAAGLHASVVPATTINCGVGAAAAAGRTAFIPVAQLIAASLGTAAASGLPATVGVGFPAPVADARQTYRGAPRSRTVRGLSRTRIYRSA